MFHPCGFSPLRWLTPRTKLQVYCALLPILRFALFSASRCLTRKSDKNGNRPQHVGFHTLLRIPLVNSVLRLHSLYLLDIYTRTIAEPLPAHQFPVEQSHEHPHSEK